MPLPTTAIPTLTKRHHISSHKHPRYNISSTGDCEILQYTSMENVQDGTISMLLAQKKCGNIKCK